MKFLFLGAGAIGTYIGGSLALAGHTVTFTERPAILETLRGKGLTLTLNGQTQRVTTAQFTGSPAEALQQTTPDVLVCALKSFDTASAIEQLRAATPTPPPILCLQNGVDNEFDLARAFGAERIIAGTVTSAIGKPGLGEIVLERKRGLGIAMTHPLSPSILEALNSADLNCRPYPAAGAMKWSKVLTNLTGNATSALLDLPVSALFKDARLFAIERGIAQECLAVMHALKHQVVDLPGTPIRAFAFAMRSLPSGLARLVLLQAVGAGRGNKMPSFHIDLYSGRGQTEVRWLNGAVARYGAEAGVPTPINHALTETLEGVSSGRIPREAFRNQPEALLQLIKV